MQTFEIANHRSGVILGRYEAETAEGALDAMARDAGYADYAACCKAAKSVDGEISVIAVA